MSHVSFVIPLQVVAASPTPMEAQTGFKRTLETFLSLHPWKIY